MERPATWKVVTLGAALTGLGIVGAAAATAAPDAAPAPVSIAASSDWAPQLGDLNLDAPGAEFVALDDDWTDTYWDNGWHGHHPWIGDWTDTYWDD